MNWLAADGVLDKVYKPDVEDWPGIVWTGHQSIPISAVPPCGWSDELCQ